MENDEVLKAVLKKLGHKYQYITVYMFIKKGEAHE
jgi:hypothetical protein